MNFLNVMYDANRNKEKVQKIANVIIAYGFYQREIKKNGLKDGAFDFVFEPPNIKTKI